MIAIYSQRGLEMSQDKYYMDGKSGGLPVFVDLEIEGKVIPGTRNLMSKGLELDI